jgi:hypothetical protein
MRSWLLLMVHSLLDDVISYLQKGLSTALRVSLLVVKNSARIYTCAQ